jgi:sortase A
MSMRRQLRRGAIAGLLVALLVLGAGFTGHAKALVAQALMSRGWASALATAEPQKPWPGSDHRVVARLAVPSLGVSRYVLDSDAGAALAFAPGLSTTDRTSWGSPTMVSAHRDTHFAFLGDVRPGMFVEWMPVDGDRGLFVVTRQVVIDSRRGQLPTGVSTEDLLLVTCWPLDSPTAGGPLRLITVARPVTGSSTSSLAANFRMDL